MSEQAKNQNINFITTQWSMILDDTKTHSSASSRALEILCHQYYQPILAFIRHRHRDHQEAEDLCQSFFTFLIEKRIYRAATPNNGRFRTFLLTSVKNFLKNHYRDSSRQKRAGGKEHLSLDDHDNQEILSDDSLANQSDDSLYDREWADAVFDHVWASLKQKYEDDGNALRFPLLRQTLAPKDEAIPYKELAEKLGLTPEGTRSAVFRFRQEFREVFQETVSRVVENPADVDDEIKHLISAYSQPKHYLFRSSDNLSI